MKINNVTQIQAEDFNTDDQELVAQLGSVLNPFMQQVVEIMDKRVDFENRVENYKQIEISVDSTGTPILNDKIKTDKTSIRGTEIIAAFNLTKTGDFPTSKPFISYQQLSGGIIQVKNISGLAANDKYRLNIIFY